MLKNPTIATTLAAASPKAIPQTNGPPNMPSTVTKLLIKAIRPSRSAWRFMAFKAALPLAFLLLIDIITLPLLLPPQWTLASTLRAVTAYVLPLAALVTHALFDYRQGSRRLQRRLLHKQPQ